jgi:hypothetical protein
MDICIHAVLSGSWKWLAIVFVPGRNQDHTGSRRQNSKQAPIRHALVAADMFNVVPMPLTPLKAILRREVIK